MTSRNILAIEDSNGHNQSCRKELGEKGFTISFQSSAKEALKNENKPEIIILNLKLNSEGNKNLLEKFKKQNIPVILCSEWGKDKMSFRLWGSGQNRKSGRSKRFKVDHKRNSRVMLGVKLQ